MDYEYGYKKKTDSAWTSGSPDIPKDDTGKTVTGLTNGTVYEFRIRTAYVPSGSTQGTYSAYVTAEVTVGTPTEPTGVTLTPGANRLAVSWTAPSSLHGGTVEQYVVEYRAGTTGSWTTVEPGSWDSGNIAGPKSTLERQPVDFGDVGDSGLGVAITRETTTHLREKSVPSDPDETLTGAIYKVGAAVTNGLRLRANGTKSVNESIHLRYYHAGKPSSYPYDTAGALLQSGSGGSFDLAGDTSKPLAAGSYFWLTGIDNSKFPPDQISNFRLRIKNFDVATATGHTVTGLTNGTRYQVRVKARTQHGDGGYSAVTGGVAGAPPGMVTGVNLASGDRQLVVTWSETTADPPVTSYNVQYRLTTSNTWIRLGDPSGGALVGTTLSSNDASHGSGGDPLDLGDISHATLTEKGLSFHKESVGTGANAKAGVYRLGAGVKSMYFRAYAVQFNQPATVKVRYAATKPSATNLHTHGAELCSQATTPSAGKHSATCAGAIDDTTGPIPAGGYIWAFTEDSETSVSRSWVVQNPAPAFDGRKATIPKLTNGSEYQVQVKATSSAGDGTSWSATSTAKAGGPDAPDAPTLAPGNASLSVAWTAPANNGSAITDYDVQYKAKAANAWSSHSFTGTGTSTTISSGITNGTGYEVQVRATNRNGTGAWSPSASQKAGVPAAPAPPTLVPGLTQLVASWTAPANNGSAIDDYDVRYCSTSCDVSTNWTELADTTPSTTLSATITTLTTGTSYRVQVRAGNTHGDGNWSASATAAAGGPGAPAAPTLASGNAQLSVAWTAPAHNGGSAITDYDVQYSSDGGSNWTEWNAGNTGTTLSATITTLTNGTSYQVQVRAANANGDGPWSPSATLKAGLPAAPAAPTLTSGNAQLSVSWTAPAHNGSAITDYDVRHCSANCDTATNWTELADSTPSTALSATITTLTNGTSYQVQVRAANTHGDGPWSPSATLKAGLPAAPAAPTLTSGNAQLAAAWTAPANNGSAITDYDVQYSSDGGSTWTEWNAGDTGTTLSATITTLTNGTSYQVQVRAANTHGDGPWSPSATLKAGLPAAPAAPTLAPGNAQLSVSWTAPANNGSAITDYDVQYKAKTANAWTSHAFTGTGTSTTISSGITNGTEYEAQVRAVNAHGNGPWSPSASLKAGVPVAPAAPTLTADNASLAVGWTAPANNGSAITDYDVQYKAKTANAWTTHAFTGTGTSTTITTLTNDTEYEVQVRAVNANGDGPWSDAASGTPAAQAPDAPAKPTIAVNIMWWSAPASNGASITDYDIQYSSDSGATWTEWDPTTTSTSSIFVLTVLPGGQTVALQVRAENSAGAGPWSPSSDSYAVPKRAPDKPAPRLTPGNQSLGVSWTAPESNGEPITDYDVRHSLDGATWTELPDNTPSTARTATITGLTNGYTYFVQVRATNSLGDSAWSDSVLQKVGVPDAPAPQAAPGNAQLFVNWEAPASNGSNITDYDVQYSSDGGGTWTDWKASETSTSTRATITGLTNGTSYHARVRAANSLGDGPWSPPVTLIAGAPTRPSPPSLTPGNLQLSVTWTAPLNNGSAITAYYVRYSTDQATWTTSNVTVNFAARSATITGLTGGTLYYVSVAAENARGTGAHSVASSLKAITQGAPAAPIDLWVLPKGTSLEVSWVEPADNGSAITDYDVRYRATGTLPWTEWKGSVTGTATEVTITGLTATTTYEVQARAENAIGAGPWTASVSRAPGSPEQPHRPYLVATQQGLRVTFHPSVPLPNNNGSAITDYDVRFSLDQGKTWTEYDPGTTGRTLNVTIQPFLHAMIYWVQVRAENARGSGPWSRISPRRHWSDFDLLDCSKDTTTNMGVGAYCDITVGVDGVKPFNGVQMDQTDASLLYKIREGPRRGNGAYFAEFVAINPAGGSATIETTLDGVVQDTFTINVRPFAIKRVTMTPAAPAANSSFELLVELNSPMSGIPDKFPSSDPTTLFRSWVELTLPAGAGWSANSDPDLSGSGITKPVQMVPWYGNWVKFTVQTQLFRVGGESCRETVIPAKAGIQKSHAPAILSKARISWIPAFAGMTVLVAVKRLKSEQLRADGQRHGQRRLHRDGQGSATGCQLPDARQPVDRARLLPAHGPDPADDLQRLVPADGDGHRAGRADAGRPGAGRADANRHRRLPHGQLEPAGVALVAGYGLRSAVPASPQRRVDAVADAG